MGMEKSKFVYNLVLVGTIILAGFAIFRLYQINEKNNQELPYLLQGENIEGNDFLPIPFPLSPFPLSSGNESLKISSYPICAVKQLT